MTEKDLENINRVELKALLKRKDFRRFIQRILLACRANSCGYVQGSFDGTAFNCGQVSIGLMLKEWIKQADKHVLVKIEEEYEKENNQIEAESEEI